MNEEIKTDVVEEVEKKKDSIAVEFGNVEGIKIQFLQALNNQMNVIIKLLQEIKDK